MEIEYKGFKVTQVVEGEWSRIALDGDYIALIAESKEMSEDELRKIADRYFEKVEDHGNAAGSKG